MLSKNTNRISEAETSDIEAAAKLRPSLTILQGKVWRQRWVEATIVAADVEAGADERGDG